MEVYTTQHPTHQIHRHTSDNKGEKMLTNNLFIGLNTVPFRIFSQIADGTEFIKSTN